MSSEWLYWGSGSILAVLGSLLLLWSLFSDRSRGRKRCPKCWYDMSNATADAPLRCPECGNQSKSARKLHKTRRRWKWAFASFIPFLGAGYLAVQPKVRENGWISITPNTVLVLSLRLPDPTWALNELDERKGELLALDPHFLWNWQWSLAAGALGEIALNGKLNVGVRQDALLLYCLRRSTLEDQALIDGHYEILKRAAEDPNEGVRKYGIVLMAECPDHQLVIDLLWSKLDDPSRDVQLNAISGFMLASRTNPLAYPALQRALDHSSEKVRADASYFIGRVAQRQNASESIFDRLVQMHKTDASDTVRARLLKSLCDLKVHQASVNALLVEACDDANAKVREEAISQISFVDEPTPEMFEVAVRLLRDSDSNVQDSAGYALDSMNPVSLFQPHVEELKSIRDEHPTVAPHIDRFFERLESAE